METQTVKSNRRTPEQVAAQSIAARKAFQERQEAAKMELRGGLYLHRQNQRGERYVREARRNETINNKEIARETGTDWEQFGGFHYEDPAIAKLRSGVYPFADPPRSLTNSSSTWQVVGAR